MTPKQHGLETGYRDDRVEQNVLPPCPYALYADTIKPKIRNPDRDEWLKGWFIGRSLRRRHEAELNQTFEQEQEEKIK